jgi:hypothetical protein
LRRLREDGAFDRESKAVQIAAYLYSKWNWEKLSIERLFSDLTNWPEYEKSLKRVKRIIKKSWPERFNRISSALKSCTKKQRDAFQAYYDIDEVPTIDAAAQALKIDRSSLNERLLNLRNRLRDEFSELSHIKRKPRSWSQSYDLLFHGFYRKSGETFQRCLVTNQKSGETKEFSKSTYDKSTYDKSTHERIGVNESKIRSWLRLRMYAPEMKAVLAGTNRGAYVVKKGGYFHHPQAWKDAYRNRDLDEAATQGSSRTKRTKNLSLRPIAHDNIPKNRIRFRLTGGLLPKRTTA